MVLYMLHGAAWHCMPLMGVALRTAFY